MLLTEGEVLRARLAGGSTWISSLHLDDLDGVHSHPILSTVVGSGKTKTLILKQISFFRFE